MNAIWREVNKARVVGVFVSSRQVWGTPETPPWTHLSGAPHQSLVRGTIHQASGAIAASYTEDFRLLSRAIHEYRVEEFREMLSLLDSGYLVRSGSFVPKAKWLFELAKQVKEAPTTRQERNLLWRAVATAPTGFCHINATVLGTLLQAIPDGLPFGEIKSRFTKMVDPLSYQRQTTLHEGNVDQAEKLVKSLGIEFSLKRRFARLEEVQPFWSPSLEVKELVGRTLEVFDHLRPSKPVQRRLAIQIPPRTMTWVKFKREILPAASGLETLIEEGLHYPLAALVVPAYPEAPSLLKWPNGVSWYLYHGGSRPAYWGLSEGWAPVAGLCVHPALWGFETDAARVGDDRVFFLLEGARDLRYDRGGAFFPTQVRSDLHGIRATLEAYANKEVVEGKEEMSACGLMLEKDRAWNLRGRVNEEDTYFIDRWD
jgi:hypothetical protein